MIITWYILIMRILVIEDEKGIADVIANKLRQAEYVVDVCYDGLDGYYDARSGGI